MLDGFGREEMDGFLRFGQLHAQASEFLFESVEPLVHLGAKLLHLRSQLVGRFMHLRSQLVGRVLHLSPQLISGVLDFCS